MNPAQTATLKYWQTRYPAQFAQALQNAGVSGFGQTGTFNDIMSSLTGLLTSYGQYKVATDIATSQSSANRNLLGLPGSGVAGVTGSTNWILYGGIALVGVVVLMFVMKKKK